MAESIAQSLFSWEDSAGSTHTLDVDVVVSATDKRSAKLTDHVVENGSVITDHVIIQPESLSLELVVTQTPLSISKGFGGKSVPITAESRTLKPATYPLKVRPSDFVPGGFLALSSGVRSAITRLLGAVGPAPSMQGSTLEKTRSSLSVKVLKADAPLDRVNDAFDRLIEIRNGALLVTVSFKGRLYIDYLLTEVELSQRAGEFGMGRFRVEARAFRTVTGTTVRLPSPADFRALPTSNKGNKPSAAGEIMGPPERATSDWAKATDGLNGIIDGLRGK